MATTAAVTVMFAATPFLLAPVAARYGVSEGSVGLISVAQVGAFAAANFAFPRLLRPNGHLLRIAALLLFVINGVSILPSSFPILVSLRALAGLAAGTLTWLAWANAMHRRGAMPAIAATGTITAFIAAPILSLLAEQGDRYVYAALAIVTVPAFVLVAPVAGRRRARGVISASRSNRVLLAALFALTFFGTALFINLTIVARDVHNLSAFAASIAFSLNALGGLVGARLSTRHRIPGWFMASIGFGALMTMFGPPILFYVGMFWWGCAFWLAVPGVLQMLVDRSLEPSERAGDGQGIMALGRAVGPILGGFFVNGGSLGALAVVAAAGIGAAGATVIGVKEGRDRLPATDAGSIDQRGP